MSRSTSAERVKRRRDKMRAAGLRPVQIWLPDASVAGFAAECRRQCEAIAAIAATEQTDAVQADIVLWEQVSADARDDLG
jgi:hypothetical protein